MNLPQNNEKRHGGSVSHAKTEYDETSIISRNFPFLIFSLSHNLAKAHTFKPKTNGK